MGVWLPSIIKRCSFPTFNRLYKQKKSPNVRLLYAKHTHITLCLLLNLLTIESSEMRYFTCKIIENIISIFFIMITIHIEYTMYKLVIQISIECGKSEKKNVISMAHIFIKHNFYNVPLYHIPC